MPEELVEKLAKTMAKPPTDAYWDTAHNEWKEMWRERARAALSHLKIPPEAGEVDVGRAVEVLQQMRGLVYSKTKGELLLAALRALGVEVDK